MSEPPSPSNRHPRRRTLAGLAALSLGACGADRRETGQIASGPPATLGLVDWVGYLPLYVAAEKNFLTEAGINLTVRTFPANGQTKIAFASGKIEAEANITAGVVDLAATGKDFRIVMVVDRSLGADALLASRSVRALEDLKGRKIALELGSVSHFFLLEILAKVGLGSKDVSLLDMTPDAAAAAYGSGAADVAVTYAPFVAAANRSRPDGRILYDSTKMPYAIADLYCFDAGFVRTRPGEVQAFVNAVFRGLDYFESHRDEALAIAARRLKITPAEVADYLGGVRLVDRATNRTMLTDRTSPAYLGTALDKLSAFLKQQGQIKAQPRLDNVLDPRFVLAAQ